MIDKVIDYSVSVKDKTVTLTIKSQISDIKKYLAKKKKFGKYELESECCVEVQDDTIFLIGSDKSAPSKKDSIGLDTSSEAFAVAAAISDSLDKFAKFVTKIKADEKKAEDAKKATKSSKVLKTGSEFEYSVSVDGRVVTFEVLKQTEKVRSFFYTERRFARGRIESAACPQIVYHADQPKIYIKGSHADTKTTSTCTSNSAALKLAANITALFDEAQKAHPDVFSDVYTLKYVDKFVPDCVYLDTNDGELLIATSDNRGLGNDGRALRTFCSEEKWIRIPATLSTVVKLFGGLDKTTVLKKFKAMNSKGTKQIWHV